MALLASMIRESNEMVTYTGAGISVAAGIDDYATPNFASITSDEMPRVRDWKDARPTRTHRVLTAMHHAGFLKHWIQQNHDSLPQKAGYPQHCLVSEHSRPASPYPPQSQLRRTQRTRSAFPTHHQERDPRLAS